MEFTALALAVMAAFIGASLYASVVEHPARREVLDGEMLAQWQRAYPRSVPLQRWLPVAGCFFGLLALLWAGRALNLTGALLAIGLRLVSSRWIAPIERVLLATAPETADAGTRAVLEKWNMANLVRAGVAFVALICFFGAL